MTNLAEPGILRLDGTNANEFWTIIRENDKPWLLNISELTSGDRLRGVQLSAIRQIVVNGNGGIDTLRINTGNGPLAVSENISFDGGTETNHLEIDGKEIATSSSGTVKLRRKDWTGSTVTMAVTWKNVTPPQTATSGSPTTTMTELPLPPLTSISTSKASTPKSTHTKRSETRK